MNTPKFTAIFVCFALVAVILLAGCVKGPEIREYPPNTVTTTLGVAVGTVNDVASLDLAYYQVTEEDVGADDTDFATEEWIVTGTLNSGTFPGDMQTQNDVGVVYLEGDDDLGALTGDNVFLTPTGAGTWTQWAPSAIPNWAMVDDDPPHDGNTTYVYTNGQYDYDTYQMEDIVSFTVGTKEAGTLTVFNWCYLGFGGVSGIIQELVLTSSTLYSGDPNTCTVGGGYLNYSYEWATNPATGNEWTLSEINGLEAGTMYSDISADVVYVTSVGVVVPTQDLNYVLDVRHNITAVPAGRENYLLTMRALTDPGEDITVSVYDHVTLGWDNMFTFTTNAYATETFALIEADHVNAGEVWIRSVDVGGDADPADQFDIDLLNVRAWDVSYTLDVSFGWVGLATIGKASKLTVVGYRSAGETMTMEVWSEGAWEVLDATVLDVAPSTSYLYDIAAEDVALGAFAIRFTDNVPTDDVASVIYLDFLSLETVVSQDPPAAPIDVYVDVKYDMWSNQILVLVWWIQVGGPEPAEEIGKWATIKTDGQLLGKYEVGDGVLRVEAPWSYFDGDSHNITAVGAVSINWEWLQSSQTYYSELEYEYATNFPRLAVLLFFIIVVIVAAVAIIARVARGREEDED